MTEEVKVSISNNEVKVNTSIVPPLVKTLEEEKKAAQAELTKVLGVIEGTTTKVTLNVTKVKTSLFDRDKAIVEVDLPICESIGDYAFSYCDTIRKVNAPLCKTIGKYVFQQSGINEAYLPMCKTAGDKVFENCLYLKKVDLSKIKSIPIGFLTSSLVTELDLPMCESIGNSGLLNNKYLINIKLAVCKSLDAFCFKTNKVLTDIYLGYEGVVNLKSTTAFNEGATNTIIHVKPAYADQYATATNWASLIESGRLTIVGDYSD